MPKKRDVRYRFTLPRDLQEVQRWALAQGILNAFHAWSRRPESDDPQFIEVAAIEAALLVEKQKFQGRQGSNQPVLFRKTFSDLCARVHPAATDLFVRHPDVYKVLLKLSEEERVVVAYTQAKQYLPTVLQAIESGEPLIFEM